MADVETRADCERLVRAFYTRALADEVIGYLFSDLDLETHVPRITAFWESVLLGAGTYGGGAFAPHARLDAQVGLRGGHFVRWVALWDATVDELFAGPVADRAKVHAARTAAAFNRRLRHAAAPPPAPAGGLTVIHRYDR